MLGNLVSARSDGNWVPNPFTISHGDYTLAFNLADVFVLLGNLLLMTALMVVAVQQRGRLASPRAWERALVRRLRSRVASFSAARGWAGLPSPDHITDVRAGPEPPA